MGSLRYVDDELRVVLLAQAGLGKGDESFVVSARVFSGDFGESRPSLAFALTFEVSSRSSQVRKRSLQLPVTLSFRARTLCVSTCWLSVHCALHSFSSQSWSCAQHAPSGPWGAMSSPGAPERLERLGSKITSHSKSQAPRSAMSTTLSPPSDSPRRRENR